jgi:hypothetical protein
VVTVQVEHGRVTDIQEAVGHDLDGTKKIECYRMNDQDEVSCFTSILLHIPTLGNFLVFLESRGLLHDVGLVGGVQAHGIIGLSTRWKMAHSNLQPVLSHEPPTRHIPGGTTFHQ